jgi:hypothetical protein
LLVRSGLLLIKAAKGSKEPSVQLPFAKLVLRLLVFGTLFSLVAANAQPAVQSWAKRYHGGHGDDTAVSLGTDAEGNSFVTGTTYIAAGDQGIVTVKYSNIGQAIWTNSFGGDGGVEAKGLVLDTNGNVVVTGVWVNSYVTIKYSNAGVPLWTNIYEGPGPHSWLGHEQPKALAADQSGNVCLLGRVDTSAGDAWAVVKYSGSGEPLWTNVFNAGGLPHPDYSFPQGLGFDAAGDIYVAGMVMDNGCLFTSKLSSQGTVLWTNMYQDGYANIDCKLAVASTGDTFVTDGFRDLSSNPIYHFSTVKYSSDGEALWTNRYFGQGYQVDRPGLATAVAVDTNGDVYVTGNSDHGYLNPPDADYVTIKYSGAGVPLWTNRFEGSPQARPRAIAVRGDKVCVAGADYVSGHWTDFATVMYSTAGALLWTNYYDLNHGEDQVVAVCIDPLGNVYVAGTSNPDNGSSGYMTVKYTSLPELPAYLDMRVVQSYPGLYAVFEVSWTNAAFHLQYATEATGPYTDLPGSVSPFTVYGIFPIEPRKFFRLKAH